MFKVCAICGGSGFLPDCKAHGPRRNATDQEAIDKAVKLADKSLIDRIGLGWDDLGDTIMVSDYISADMSRDSFIEEIREMINAKLEDAGYPKNI